MTKNKAGVVDPFWVSVPKQKRSDYVRVSVLKDVFKGHTMKTLLSVPPLEEGSFRQLKKKLTEFTNHASVY